MTFHLSRGLMPRYSFFEDINVPHTDDPSCMKAFSTAAPSAVLVNGKYIPLRFSEMSDIRRGFAKDRNRRLYVETMLESRFILVETSEVSELVHLLAVPGRADAVTDTQLDPAVLWHSDKGSQANEFLEDWVIEVKHASCPEQVPSLHTFWCGGKRSGTEDARELPLPSVERPGPRDEYSDEDEDETAEKTSIDNMKASFSGRL